MVYKGICLTATSSDYPLYIGTLSTDNVHTYCSGRNGVFYNTVESRTAIFRCVKWAQIGQHQGLADIHWTQGLIVVHILTVHLQ